MAQASPLPFPSPSAILGDNAPAESTEPTALAPATAQPILKNHAHRPLKEPKMAPPRKPAAADVKDAGSAAKPKQTKSRNGCLTCKAKRLKCGEEKPGCVNCAKRKVACGGYKKVFQWRDYGKPDVKTNLERQKQATSTSPLRQIPAECSKSTTPSTDTPPRLHNAPLPNTHVRKASRKISPRAIDDSDSERPQLRRTHPTPLQLPEVRPQDTATSSPIDEKPEPAPPPATDLPGESDSTAAAEFASVTFTPSSVFAYRSRSLSPSPVKGSTPTLTEFLIPGENNDLDNNQDFVAFSMPEDYQFPPWLSGADDPTLIGEGFVDDDIFAMHQFEDVWPSHSRLHTPSGSTSSSSPGNSLLQWNGAMMPQLYIQPDFPPDSPEALAVRFDRMTCGILSVMDGPTENPWRSLIWPMAQQSPALYNAVLAMTAFHSSTDVPALKMAGNEHRHLSIQNIQEGIRNNSMTDQMAIATALALGFCESWDQHIATGNTHIKGAQALVKRAIDQHNNKPFEGLERDRLKFLCNAWVYMDVIARLTSVDSDESNDFDNTFLFAADAPRSVMGNGRSQGFGIDFGMPVDARLDPLMGCAGSLFPLIGRVANLVRKVCRTQSNSPGIVSHARDLKMMLDDWDPPEEIEDPEDPTTGVQHALQTAEAYRWATLLHLHQAVPELPSLSSAQISQKVLACLATVPLASRTVIVQIYPLMVAGCEAADAEDRVWIRERWLGMANRMRIGIIEKCLAVTEEVWRRKDVYHSKSPNRRKLVKTADLQPTRGREQTLKRKPTDSCNSGDPGRTGMVFSFVEGDTEPMGSSLKELNGPSSAHSRRDVSDRVVVDPAYSVRGHLHWIGVMWAWEWEILLG